MYFLSETHYFQQDYSVLIVTLVGPLTRKSEATFLQCLEEISKSTAKWVVLNFRDVPGDLDSSFLPLMGQFKEISQQKAMNFKLSGVHPHLRGVLKEHQLADPDQLVDNLADVISILPNLQK